MNSKKDQNGRDSLIAVSSADGRTILGLVVDPVTHRLHVTSATVGDNGNNNGNAMLDENSVPVMTAKSFGGSIVEIYIDPSTKALFVK